MIERNLLNFGVRNIKFDLDAIILHDRINIRLNECCLRTSKECAVETSRLRHSVTPASARPAPFKYPRNTHI